MAALHDMGGRTEFFGPIVREPDEPVFHERWEGRVFGISWFVLLLFGRNIDAFRFALERLPRETYLSNYYRRWLGGFETMLVEAGYLGPAEVDARIEGRPAKPGARRASAARREITSRALTALLRPRLPRWLAAYVLPRVLGGARPAFGRPRFRAGDQVQVRDHRASGHTRQPGYVTGKSGVVVGEHGSALLPDAHAVHRRSRPQHLYTVAFDATDLWGDAAEPDTEMRVDLFECYLKPRPEAS